MDRLPQIIIAIYFIATIVGAARCNGRTHKVRAWEVGGFIAAEAIVLGLGGFWS